MCIRDRLKEAQERQQLENENRQLKVQVEYLEKDLAKHKAGFPQKAKTECGNTPLKEEKFHGCLYSVQGCLLYTSRCV